MPTNVHQYYRIAKTTCVKYLGLDLRAKLNCHKHNDKKRKQIDFKVQELYWPLKKKFEMSLDNKYSNHLMQLS